MEYQVVEPTKDLPLIPVDKVTVEGARLKDEVKLTFITRETDAPGTYWLTLHLHSSSLGYELQGNLGPPVDFLDLPGNFAVPLKVYWHGTRSVLWSPGFSACLVQILIYELESIQLTYHESSKYLPREHFEVSAKIGGKEYHGLATDFACPEATWLLFEKLEPN